MHPIITIEVVRERRQRYVSEAQAWRIPPAPARSAAIGSARQAVGWALVRAGLRLVEHPPGPALRAP